MMVDISHVSLCGLSFGHLDWVCLLIFDMLLPLYDIVSHTAYEFYDTRKNTHDCHTDIG